MRNAQQCRARPASALTCAGRTLEDQSRIGRRWAAGGGITISVVYSHRQCYWVIDMAELCDKQFAKTGSLEGSV